MHSSLKRVVYADVENGYVGAVGRGVSQIGRVKLTCVRLLKQMPSRKLLHGAGTSAACSVTTSGAGLGEWGGGEIQEGGDICIPVVDSFCCTAEANATL